MGDQLTRDDLVEVLESMLEGQLRAVRALRGGRRAEGAGAKGAGKKSNISVVEDILAAAGVPLHVSEIIVRARRDHGRELKRESIVSALTKKVLEGRTFRRAGRNEFALLGKA